MHEKQASSSPHLKQKGTIIPSFCYQMGIISNESIILPQWWQPGRAKMASEGRQFPVDWEEEALAQVIIQ